MKYSLQIKGKKRILTIASAFSLLIATQSSFSAPGDKVHAFFADEHNTSATSTTGNRILEIDIDNMSLVNSLNVSGNLGHHADNGFNSKIYGVPKGSNYVNVVDLRKDQNGTTSMNNTKQITLIHKPRSGDAYNKKFNIILMAASNRPMGSFINVETDKVVGTIGENVDCRLTDGSMLLSHSDANTSAGAMKYQCVTPSHGGTQVSGHPYWLTPDYAAIVDRSNKQISVYHVQQVGSQIVGTLVNHMPTRTSVHQIVPRDRTNLPGSQQADFYAIEEGEHTVSSNNYSGGVPHALIKMKLTTNGLQFVRRMNLQRSQVLSKTKADRILNSCISIYRNTFNSALTGPSRVRERRYNNLFSREGITRSPDQDAFNDFPIDCFYPGIPGGHNADFAPNNKHLYIGMAGGAMSIVDVNRWKIANNIDIGLRTGPGHTCFSQKNNVALSSNHAFSSIFGASMTRTIRYINSERPIGYYWIKLPFSRENITNTAQSHTCYVDEAGDNYYNFYTDGGVFYKIDLTGVFNNPTNGSDALVVDSLYTGGIPIQGSYIYVKNIKSNTPSPVFAANNDSATSSGSAIDIDVLANDTGNNLILEIADGADHGKVSIVNGKARYTPNQGFSGTDGFWYGVSSPGVEWKWAYVDIKVSSVVIPPKKLKAVNDTASVSPGNSVTIDVLANDSGTNISLGVLDTPWTGTVTKSGNKAVYTAAAGFKGSVDFWYSVVDSAGNEEWANVVVNIGVSAGVAANNDTATVRKGRTVTINVLDNDTGPNLALTTIDPAWTGITTKSGNSIVYQAPANFTGTVDIWYGMTASTGEEQWAVATVTITN